MSTCRFVLSLAWSIAIANSLVADVWFSAAPASVQSGQSYYVEASDYDADVYVYKNGNSFASNSSSYATAGAWTSDAGPQTVNYMAESYSWYYSTTWAYASVNVSAPSNTPPTPWVQIDGNSHGATVVRPYGGSVNVTVRYKATDPNGNLSGIRPQVWDPAGNLNNNGGAFVSQSGSSGEVVWTVTLNQNGNWYFWTDAQDTVIAPSYVDSGAWTNGFRLTVTEAPPPNQNPQTQWVTSTSPFIGQAATFTGNATDPDGNLQSMHFYVNGPNLPGWNHVGSASISGGSATAGLNWTAGVPGNYGVHIRAVDAAGVWDWNGNVMAGFTVTNRDPSVSVEILNATQNVVALDGNGRARIPVGTNFYIRVNGSDPDGRLLRLYSRVNNASGNAFAYEQRDVSGASASWTFGPYNTGASVGVWDVWAHAEDQDNTGYQWQGGGWWGTHSPDIEVYQPNRAPTGSFTINGVAGNSAVVFGQSATVSSSVTDLDGNLTVHGFWWDQGNGSFWTHPVLTWGGIPPNAAGWFNLNFGADGYNASGGSSTRGFDFRATRAGTFVLHSAASDPEFWVGLGVSVINLTVNKATPASFFADRTLNTAASTYTVLAGDLNATFSNPYSGSVQAPTGAVAYSIVGPGTSVVAGTALTAGQTYTIRATYAGDSNYNGATRDAVWTVGDPNGDSDGDGMTNGWELSNGLNPNDGNDALLDPDGDGLTNVAEYNLGTNPSAYNQGTSNLGNAIPAGWPNSDANPSLAVGATVGNLSVDKSGALSYSIPIWTTPGSAGMEPQLSLNYSSNAGAGIAGFGWSIGGLSAITRGPQTKMIDGANRGVTLTANDRFYLDGQRLIAISGAYGANGTEYRTEIDSISKIVSYGSAGSGPAWFKVWTKAGLIVEFGNTPDSTFDAWGKSEKLSWHANKITDTKGSFMTFQYHEDAAIGIHRLERINYTGNGATSPYASLRFEYESRPDWVRGYVAGSPVSSLHRLKTIKSCYGETVAHSYILNYSAPRPVTGRVVLDSIVESGAAFSANNLPYRPLTFQYADSDTGWESVYANFSPPYMLADNQGNDGYGYPAGSGFLDLNGDGRTDFIAKRDGTGGYDQAFLNTGSGWNNYIHFRLPYPLAVVNSNIDMGSRFVDLNGDGLVDYIYRKHGGDGSLQQNQAFLNTGTSWQSSPQWCLPVALARDGASYTHRSGRFVDIDGDGRMDFVAFLNASGAAVNGMLVYLNNGNGWTYDASFSYPPGYDMAEYRPRFLDVNGDGLVDMVAYYHVSGTTYRRQTWLNTGTAWQTSTAYLLPQPIESSTQSSYGAEFADVNGDGLPDLVWYRELPGSILKRGIGLNTGSGWRSFAITNGPYDPIDPPAPVAPEDVELFNRYAQPSPLSRDGESSAGTALIDINADGLADVVNKRTFSNGISNNSVHYRTPESWAHQPGSPHQLPVELLASGVKKAGVDFVDLDGDGVVDIVQRRRNSNGTETMGAWRNKAKATADRMIGVTNAFGVTAQVVYDSLLNPAVYTKAQNNNDLPVADRPKVANIAAPLYVVSLVKNEDGIGGLHNIAYSYGSLRVHQDRGSLGFGWMEAHDLRSDIITNTAFKQEYPFVGMPFDTETRKAAGGILSESTVTYLDKNTTGLIRFPYASVATESSYDFGTGALIGTTTTTTGVPDAYGNITSITVSTSDGYTRTTTSLFEEEQPTAWILGRLTKSTVVSTKSGVPTQTRKSGFNYYADSGLLWKETVEPEDATNTLKLTTTYAYDSWGNKTSVTVSGANLTVDASGNYTVGATVNRTTTTQYDGYGRFPIWTKNALDHQENYTGYDQVLGVLTSMTGANGLATSWQYDSMGRKIRETRADTTVSETRYKWAAAGAPAGSLYFVETESSGSVPSLAFHDKYGRNFHSMAISGDGRIVHQHTTYDAFGRVNQAFNPYYNDGSTTYASTTTYDILGRPLTVVTPDDVLTQGVITTYAYNGLVGTATDPKLRVTETTKNAQGWTVSNIRNKTAGTGALDYSAVTYGYDVLGNLTSTVAAGVTTTIAYDGRGRKTSMTDADMGTWHYRYNVFGELIWQKDAKNQIVTMAYDALGRLTSRVETEGTTTWTYDTSPTKGKGKLHTVASPGGYLETYLYDTLGRPASVTRKIDTIDYLYQTAYDSLGRPIRTIYPATGIGSTPPFSTRHVYNQFGFLKEIRVWIDSDTGQPLNDLHGKIYWMADSYDVSGRIDGETYGNGLCNDRVYSDATGRLLRATIDRGMVIIDPFAVQDLRYTYDAVGNVNTRVDATTNRSEQFYTTNPGDGYDGLDRLRVHKVNGAVSATVAYNQLGNITSKSDVGSYTYGSPKPHAVTAAGGNSYTYDANGNMTTGGGRTLEWTSFNQLKKVTGPGNPNSEFSFGAARERVKQVRKNNTTLLDTTIYAGALYERIIGPGENPLVEHRHYVVAPTGRVAVFSDSAIGSAPQGNFVRYFHTDGLGSVTVVTDEKGAVVKRFAYDAWGKQSTLANTTPFTATAVASVGNLGGFTRGYTDHEMLADVGLIHMNGRVYDPVLGRFLSADPNIDGVSDAQGFNRYSYVGNNPLGATDPTGYFSLKDFFKIVAIVVVAWVTAGAALYAMSTYTTLAGVSYSGIGAAMGAIAGSGTLTLGGAIIAGAGAGFGSGFAGSLLNGGSIGDAFKAGIIGGIVGGITGGLAYGIGGSGLGPYGKALAHGTVQGAAAEAQGGQFRHGFYAGFATKLASPRIGKLPQQSRWIGAAIVGGTASAIGGGKFANGAVSGAFQYLLNDAQHDENGDSPSLAKRITSATKTLVDAVRNPRAIWKEHAAPHFPKFLQGGKTVTYGFTGRGVAQIGGEYGDGIYMSYDFENLKLEIGRYRVISLEAGFEISASMSVATYERFDINGPFNAFNASALTAGMSVYFDADWNYSGIGYSGGLSPFSGGLTFNPSWTSTQVTKPFFKIP